MVKLLTWWEIMVEYLQESRYMDLCKDGQGRGSQVKHKSLQGHYLSRTEPRIVYFKSYYVELQEQRLQSLRGIGNNCLTIEG